MAIFRPATARSLLLGGLFLSMLCCASSARADTGNWSYARHGTWEILSALPPEQTQRQIVDLHGFVHAFRLSFPVFSKIAEVPVTMVFTPDGETFVSLLPDPLPAGPGTAGVFINRADRGFIVLRPLAGRATRIVLFHEYTHRLLAGLEGWRPLWLEEGLAEVFSSYEQTPVTALLGRARDDHTAFLARTRPWIPLERLFAMDQTAPEYKQQHGVGLFYAQSWLLTHYGLFGRNEADRRAFLRWMDHVAQAPASEEAFRQIFGYGYEEMQRRLQAYLRRGGFRVASLPVRSLPALPSLEFSAAPPAKISLVHGELQALSQRPREARRLLYGALEDPSLEPRALGILGMVEGSLGNTDLALAHWENAREKGSTLPMVHANLGQWRLRSWQERALPGDRLTAARTGELLEYFYTAHQHGLRDDRLYQAIAQVWLSSELTIPSEHMEVLRAGLRRHPTAAPLRLMVVRLALRAGWLEEALRHLRHPAAQFEGAWQDQAQELEERISP